jgi:colanic acid biosynthesis glycosyl transferase WcaI
MSHPVTGRHVTIVGISYTPEPTGIAPRTRGLAHHLARHAASVTVLTGLPHYQDDKAPAAQHSRLNTREIAHQEPISEVPVGLVVRRLRHTTPSRQAPLTQACYEMTCMTSGWAQGLQPAPSLVVAITPSLSGAVAGARLAERHGARLLVVVQDLMARAAIRRGAPRGSRTMAATAALERFALRRADRVAVASDSFRPEVENYGVPPDRVSVLRTGALTKPGREAALHRLDTVIAATLTQ